MTWPIHPAAEWFPLVDSAELDELAADIKSGGLLNPVTLFQDPSLGLTLLDGRNRVAACKRAGVEVRTVLYEGSDPYGFVIGQNVRRRHLTTGQLAAIAVQRLDHHQAEAERRMLLGRIDPTPGLGEGPTVTHGEAVDLAAAEVGTSGTSVSNYRKVEKQRPDLAEKVKSGDLPLDRAYQQVKTPKSAPRTLECGQCGKAFDHRVWHCAKCDKHWPHGKTCGNCPPVETPWSTGTRVMKANPSPIIVANAINSLSGLVMGLERVDPNSLGNEEEAIRWADDLSKTARFLANFAKQLRGAINAR